MFVVVVISRRRRTGRADCNLLTSHESVYLGGTCFFLKKKGKKGKEKKRKRVLFLKNTSQSGISSIKEQEQGVVGLAPTKELLRMSANDEAVQCSAVGITSDTDTDATEI